MLIVVGAVVAIAFGDHSEVTYSLSELQGFFIELRFIGFTAGAGGMAVLSFIYLRKAEPLKHRLMEAKRNHANSLKTHDLTSAIKTEHVIKQWQKMYERWEKIHPVCYCYLAGYFGAQTLIFAKCIAELLRTTGEGDNQFVFLLTYVFLIGMLVTIVVETHFLAHGLKFFDALYIVPVFQCFFISLGAMSGGVFFNEFGRFNLTQGLLFPLGVCITLAGVYILSSREMSVLSEEERRRSTGFIATRKARDSFTKALSTGRRRAEAQSVDNQFVKQEMDDGFDDSDEDDLENRDIVPELMTRAEVEKVEPRARGRSNLNTREGTVPQLEGMKSQLFSPSSVLFSQFMGLLVNQREVKRRNSANVLTASRARSYTDVSQIKRGSNSSAAMAHRRAPSKTISSTAGPLNLSSSPLPFKKAPSKNSEKKEEEKADQFTEMVVVEEEEDDKRRQSKNRRSSHA